MKTLVAIPMKDPLRAKTRLASVFETPERSRLAMALFERTLAFFHHACADFDVVVVTASETIARCAREGGAIVLREAGERGLNAAAARAAAYAGARSYGRLIIVPADIPIWLREEVEHVLTLSLRVNVALAEAHDGGTNMLIMTPPRPFEFSYGTGSADLHEAAAHTHGLSVARCRLPFIGHDIDTPDDCLALVHHRRRGHEACATTTGVPS
ncbi:2-phospho-L-lactate guanylyltransferase [Trinickia mobilis]|uniref:2-phospho-L-lactate guanylyltransferase n=1 Tax=Trinickia mobilis TaxID=2816356 RepID=UPI001A8DEFAD|nr:2-phospho-L-lactate guanylyltransferase [Trinickia mobilis]